MQHRWFVIHGVKYRWSFKGNFCSRISSVWDTATADALIYQTALALSPTVLKHCWYYISCIGDIAKLWGNFRSYISSASDTADSCSLYITSNSEHNSKIFKGIIPESYGVDSWKTSWPKISCYCTFNLQHPPGGLVTLCSGGTVHLKHNNVIFKYCEEMALYSRSQHMLLFLFY
jgi:hypothetical protein